MYSLPRLVEISAALRQRKVSDHNFHVTFAFHKKRLLAIGVNSAKTHPRNLQLPHIDPETKVAYHDQASTHAELSCVIRMGKENCKDISFVNIRLGAENQLRIAKPCPACQALLNQVGFKRVCYSTGEGTLAELTNAS